MTFVSNSGEAVSMAKRELGAKEVHHGRTPAAWAGSLLALAGFIVLVVGFLTGPNGFPSININISIVGAAMVVLAPILGGILNKAGLGQDA